MPKKLDKNNLTPKQEKFCQKYVELGSATEAYKKSYNASKMKATVINVKACELLKSGNVAVRIGQLQNYHLEKHEITIKSLLKELDEARKIAHDLKEASPMITATMGKAKIAGFLKDKFEHTGKNGGAIQHEFSLSQEEIKRRADEMRAYIDGGDDE